MKVRVRPWRLIWRFLVTLLGIYAFIFIVSFSMFFDTTTGKPIVWDFRQPLMIGLIFAFSLGVFIPSLINAFYTIENSFFTVKRMSKTYEFSYSNIEYIDLEKSNKKKKVIFYIKGAKWQYLLADKDNVLLETLLKKCKNLKSREEFFRAHPEEK